MKRLLAAMLVFFVVRTSAIVRADDEPGHSSHGEAFDSGLRQKPWHMEGIGTTHFPITSKVTEVQSWFDQGNTLLHSFWYEEAERSFRWCLKLDPDCAMAYWGLARATHGKRSKDFLKEAVRRRDAVTPRERMYIDAWDAALRGDEKDTEKELATRLQQVALKYPDDVEAKALYALYSMGGERALGVEMVLQQVLAVEPNHPGAHHYRIHNWDGTAPEEAIKSCLRYGQIAPNIGHAEHMPGHVYSKVGMWHEAARSMDSATRVELRYMNERLALPFETWNYAYNRNYLCYIQEQLGRADDSLRGARDLLSAPRDPQRDYTNPQGITALVRALVKFERWPALLDPKEIPWSELQKDSGPDWSKELRAFAETLAYIGEGNLTDASARLDDLKAICFENAGKGKDLNSEQTVRVDSAEGLMRAAQGNILDAARLLSDAAATEQKLRDAHNWTNDPPDAPWPAMRLLGDVYLKSHDYKLAVAAYDRSLVLEPNDGFSLSGLAQAHFALGERSEAQRCYGRLLYVWSGADPGLKWRKAADMLGLIARPVDETPSQERPYHPEELSQLGPSNWEPFAAPTLVGKDVNNKEINLAQYRGKNVLLVFFLSDECAHCVDQLTAINARSSDWSKENTVVLAVSGASPDKNRASEKLGKLGITLVSDSNHENARRFASYDDFEGIELHSTVLIDAKGRVHWKRTGGEPFKDVDFLLKVIKRMNSNPVTTI